MKIVVIGGTGLIGKKLINELRRQGHEAVSASPSSGVNAVTGEGLAQVFTGAQVVVDVSNSPSFEDKAALEFFESSGHNICAAELAAGVKHHIALSVVGTDQLLASGYFRAKMAQEQLIKASNIPYTIVRATQFFEFLDTIVQGSTQNETVKLPPAKFQPIAADDVAMIMAEVALAEPMNDKIDIAGPDRGTMADLIQRFLQAKQDPREVIADVNASYFGLDVNNGALAPAGDNARIGSTPLETWLESVQTANPSFRP